MNVISVMLLIATLCLVGFAGVIAHGDRLEKKYAAEQAAAAEARRREQLRRHGVRS